MYIVIVRYTCEKLVGQGRVTYNVYIPARGFSRNPTPLWPINAQRQLLSERGPYHPCPSYTRRRPVSPSSPPYEQPRHGKRCREPYPLLSIIIGLRARVSVPRNSFSGTRQNPALAEPSFLCVQRLCVRRLVTAQRPPLRRANALAVRTNKLSSNLASEASAARPRGFFVFSCHSP